MSPRSYFATRRWLQLGLIVGGFLGGAVLGLVLTRFGKILADAPPATLGNYLWNAGVFGVLSGIVSPLITWSTLRNAPLWRTVAEPLAWATAGGALAVLTGLGPLILILPPVGLAAGMVRLQRRYPDRHAQIAPVGDSPPKISGPPTEDHP